jgi:hypothetical protein
MRQGADWYKYISDISYENLVIVKEDCDFVMAFFQFLNNLKD